MHKLVFTYGCEFKKENEEGIFEDKNIVFSGNIIVQVRYIENEQFITFSEYLNSAIDSDEDFQRLIDELINDVTKIKNVNFYYIEDEEKYFLHHFEKVNRAIANLKVMDSTEVSYANTDFKLCKNFEVR